MTTVNEKIAWFKSCNFNGAFPSTENQFINMARGGTGEESDSDGSTIRSTYYEYMNDKFFQDVCDGMDWRWR